MEYQRTEDGGIKVLGIKVDWRQRRQGNERNIGRQRMQREKN